jgi:hypothetical protein
MKPVLVALPERGEAVRTSLYFLRLVVSLVGYQMMPGRASSHREAPLISNDPQADNTDVYALVSPDKPDTVTMIASYIPRTRRDDRKD